MRVLQLRLVGICILIRVAPRSRRLFTKKIRSTVGYRIGGAFPREHLLFFARNVRNRRQLAGFPIFFPPPFSSFPSSFFHKRVTDLDRERSLDYENLSREREREARVVAPLGVDRSNRRDPIRDQPATCRGEIPRLIHGTRSRA